MSVYFTSLNSGSNGNCYYVGNDQEAILVDAGLSCRETEKRLKRLDLSLQKVKAIFISHEHSDHISGLAQLARKHRLPVYATIPTLRGCRFPLDGIELFPFQPNETVSIGELQVMAFPKHHDAADPHSFIVSYQGINVGVFTDIGVPCEHLIHYFRQCHAAFLEANYDEKMLEDGRYPYFLKRRIRGGKGHLSNQQALELFNTHRPSYLSHLLLSHLSKDNNCPELVMNLFAPHQNDTQVIVASRYAETPVYHIHSDTNLNARPLQPKRTEITYALFN